MNFNAKLLSLISLVLLLAESTIGAPLKSTGSTKAETPAKIENDEATANELEELSKTGNVVLPAAPVVAKETEHVNKAVADEERETEQGEGKSAPVSDVDEPVQETPSKRQSPASDRLTTNSRQFPTLSSRLDNLSLYSRQPDVDLSPRAVAEYLLVTADFSGFDQALDDLLNTGILSPSELRQYKESVSEEYDNLLQQVSQAESEYLQELSRVSPLDYFNTIQQPVRHYPEYPYNQNSLEYSDLESYRDQMPSRLSYGDQIIHDYQRPQVPDYQDKTEQGLTDETLEDKERTLGDILTDMLNEYYSDQTQEGPAAEYDVDLPEDISNYQSTDNDNVRNDDIDDTVDGNNENGDNTDDDDDEIKQFMAYLQQTLTAEEAGAGIIEIPDKSDGENEQVSVVNDVAKELDELTPAGESDVDATDDDEQSSGDVDSEPADEKGSP